MARILVVDDDQAILKLAERLLTSAGHSVVGAENAVQAMELLNSGHFDLLLSDANMPQYSGFDLIRTVKNNPAFQKMAVAMLTGRKERRDIEQAVKLGVDDYIVKPFDPVLVLQKIEALLEKKPPQSLPEVLFAADAPLAKAKVLSSAQLITASELGVQLRTSLPLKEGEVIELSSDFFTQLGAPVPPLKVTISRSELREGAMSFVIQTIYLGAHESFLKKIRAWIVTHGSSHRAAS